MKIEVHGGIVSYFKGDILNCCNKGTISGVSYVGGIAGGNDEKIENCYNIKNINGENHVGGILGCTGSGKGEKSIINCYSLGEVSGRSYIGQIVGLSEREQVNATVRCYAGDDDFTSEDLGDAFKEDAGNINNGYPILYWE